MPPERSAVPEIVIRPLAPADSIQALTELLHRAYRPLRDRGLRYWASSQTVGDTRSRIAGGRCLVATLDGRLVGTVAYQRRSGWAGSSWFRRPEVANAAQFAVEPSLHGRGIGSRLLFFVEEHAAVEGASELAVSTAEPAAHLVRFYEKRGYRVVEKTDATLSQGYRSLILSKALARGSSL